METPYTLLSRRSKPARFGDIPVGAMFALHGNIWQKRSTRTATGHWPAILPKWSYFRQSEIVGHDVA